MKRFFTIIILTLILFVPQTSRALSSEALAKDGSFESSFAKTGFEIFSALGASVDATTDVASGIYRIASSKLKVQSEKLQSKVQNLAVIAKQAVQRQHQILRSPAAAGREYIHRMLGLSAKALRATAGAILGGLRELGKVELVFSEKQETRSLASLPTGSSTSDVAETGEPSFNVEEDHAAAGDGKTLNAGEPANQTTRYEENAEGQTIKIIERIIERAPLVTDITVLSTVLCKWTLWA